MILILIIFAVVSYYEVKYLKSKQEKLTPYIIIYGVLFLASEIVYFIHKGL